MRLDMSNALRPSDWSRFGGAACLTTRTPSTFRKRFTRERFALKEKRRAVSSSSNRRCVGQGDRCVSRRVPEENRERRYLHDALGCFPVHAYNETALGDDLL